MVVFGVHGKHAQRFTANLTGDDDTECELSLQEFANRLPVLTVTIEGRDYELSAQHYTEDSLPHHDVSEGPFEAITGTMSMLELRQAFSAAPKLRKSGRVGSILEVTLPL